MATVAAALLVTSLVTPALAQTSGRDDRARPDFSTIDTNGDGVVSLQEFEAAGDRFARADTNNDDVLDATEIAAMRADRAARMIDRLDTNDDGVLSRDEVENRRDPSRIFARLDVDENGTLTQDELAKMQGHRRGRGNR